MEREKRYYNQIMRVGIIGAGNMANAILSGILNTQKNIQITCSDISSKQLNKIKKNRRVKTTKNNLGAAENSTILFICVKPNVVESVAQEIKQYLTRNQILISVAAGVYMKSLQSFFGNDKKIIRSMPNLPCLIGKGVVGIMQNSKCTNKDMKVAENLLSSIGKIFRLKKDTDFDAVTALSGSGPAFLAQHIESNLSFAKQKGFSKAVSSLLVLETLLGTVEFLKYSKIDINKFISMVASPGGTTEEGLKSLRKNKYSKTIKDSLFAATKKSSQISRQIQNKRKQK